MAGEIALRLLRIQLLQFGPYGTMCPMAVTHGLAPVLWKEPEHNPCVSHYSNLSGSEKQNREADLPKRSNAALSRAERLRQVEEILYNAPPNGLAMTEIAKRCGVTRTTIWKDIQSLLTEGVPIWEKDRRYGILRGRYVTSVRLNLHEATALFLAARLLTRYADSHHPHVARAIEKLAAAMPKDLLQSHMNRAADVIRTRRGLPDLTRTLEQITEAWAERKRVRLWEKPKEGKPSYERLYEPHFIEPSGVGFSLYVIGYDVQKQDWRTFHIGRIERIEITTEQFEPRTDFDLYIFLNRAWGINWGGGKEVVEVRLRFPPGRITERVKASEWHMSQQIEDLPDGGCVLAVKIGDTIEMKPFIRQWGKDVIVLAPDSLRREIAEEMLAAARNYGLVKD
jgi:proteasome accessory factor B